MEKRYYFIGIGGISMSALAIFLKLNGCEVAGSDISETENLQSLKNFNMTYYIGHKEENIKQFCPDIVVINCAISKENEELVYAKNNHIKIITRAKLLGLFSKKFKNVIAISGTHGKTTTVGMISEIFIEAALKPTVHIGGVLNKIGSNFLVGDQKFFITEACEYKNSFLSLKPKVGAVINIEKDHMDFFKNYENLEQSFEKFLAKSKIKIFPECKNKEYNYLCIENNKIVAFCAKNVEKTGFGIMFKYYENNNFVSSFRLNSLGVHNVNNALIAIRIARHFKVKICHIKRALKNFSGVKRRFEHLGNIGNCKVIHDYAHHPTEISKVIAQARQFGRVLTVFQPHTYSRTKKLFKEFLSAFNESNYTVFYKTYPARETENMGYNAKKLFESLSTSVKCCYFEKEKELLNFVKQECGFDVILFLGAGNIDLVAKNLLK